MAADRIVYIARDLLEAGEDFVIAKVVDTYGSTPRKKGAWLLMKADGTRYGTVGGGKLEAETERIAKETFQTKTSQIYHFRLTPEDQQGIDMRCGGDADISIEYVDASSPEKFKEDFGPNPVAYIFGGGHVGKALDPVMRYIGFDTVIVDDRPEFASKERFPEASQVLVNDFNDAYAEIETDEDSYIIIVTRGHAADYIVLRQSLRKKNAYIGMIGSKTKIAANFGLLREDGFSQEELDKVYTPIGLKIHSETPEEIAISVAAEIIKVKAGYGER